jgi:hypothetical protein
LQGHGLIWPALADKHFIAAQHEGGNDQPQGILAHYAACRSAWCCVLVCLWLLVRH